MSQAPHDAPVEIRAPAEHSEGTRSQVLRWLKAVGDPVELNEPLIELETDKVTVEVAAPASGTLQEVLKREQEEVEPGELLGHIGLKGAAAPGAPGAACAEASLPVGSAAVAQPAESGAPLPAGSAPTSLPGLGASLPMRSGEWAASAVAGRSMPATAPPNEDADGAHPLSPAVRRLLAEHSLDPVSVRGSGQGGRITVQDVLQAASADAERTGGDAAARRVPHSAVRKRIAEHMVRSLLHTAPHVTTVFEADMSAVLRHRAEHRDEFANAGAPLTLTAYFLQAAVAAIRAVPEANSRWTDTALEVFDSIHIAVATALEEELLVPVLRYVDSLDLLGTARALNELITRARERRLTPADVRGGTFTISNHGVSGSLLAAPVVINQPQSAILGIGKLEKRVVVKECDGAEDAFAVQPRCYVTLTIDHRVLDGHSANRFMQTFVSRLASWPK